MKHKTEVSKEDMKDTICWLLELEDIYENKIIFRETEGVKEVYGKALKDLFELRVRLEDALRGK